MPGAPTWKISLGFRPWTANAERRMHWAARAELVASWRAHAAAEARRQRIPRLDRVAVEIEPTVRSRRHLPDVAACYPAAKAMIDGLVDAGVLPDDDPRHVVGQLFLAPLVADRESLAITVLALDPGHGIPRLELG